MRLTRIDVMDGHLSYFHFSASNVSPVHSSPTSSNFYLILPSFRLSCQVPAWSAWGWVQHLMLIFSWIYHSPVKGQWLPYIFNTVPTCINVSCASFEDEKRLLLVLCFASDKLFTSDKVRSIILLKWQSSTSSCSTDRRRLWSTLCHNKCSMNSKETTLSLQKRNERFLHITHNGNRIAPHYQTANDRRRRSAISHRGQLLLSIYYTDSLLTTPLSIATLSQRHILSSTPRQMHGWPNGTPFLLQQQPISEIYGHHLL